MYIYMYMYMNINMHTYTYRCTYVSLQEGLRRIQTLPSMEEAIASEQSFEGAPWGFGASYGGFCIYIYMYAYIHIYVCIEIWLFL